MVEKVSIRLSYYAEDPYFNPDKEIILIIMWICSSWNVDKWCDLLGT